MMCRRQLAQVIPCEILQILIGERLLWARYNHKNHQIRTVRIVRTLFLPRHPRESNYCASRAGTRYLISKQHKGFQIYTDFFL